LGVQTTMGTQSSTTPGIMTVVLAGQRQHPYNLPLILPIICWFMTVRTISSYSLSMTKPGNIS